MVHYIIEISLALKEIHSLKGDPMNLEHPSVQQVIAIAEEISQENKVLNTRVIYNRAKHRLKIPRNGLIEIIQLLIDKHILVDGSRYTRESVLSNRIRMFIFEIINSELGIHLSEIKRKIKGIIKEISTGQLIWHIEMLKKFGLIKKINFKNYTIFIPIDVDEQIGIIYFLLRDEINFKILKFLSERGYIRKTLVYEEIDEPREKLYYRLTTLIDNQVLMSENEEVCIVPELELLVKGVFNNLYLQTTERCAQKCS